MKKMVQKSLTNQGDITLTLSTMTYDARLWTLKKYGKHYSRCLSVREIIMFWNKGQPPELSKLDSVVPVRIRVKERNSLNNRFKLDPLIETRAILGHAMMWREISDRIAGFYPYLAEGNLLSYHDTDRGCIHGFSVSLWLIR